MAMAVSLPASGPTAAWAATASATPGASAGAASREIGRDARAGFEPQLPFGDDRLARRQSLLHHHVVADALALHDRPLLDGRIVFDDEDVLPVLTGLHRL